MNPKHDRTHSRTAADIERKYDLSGIGDQSNKIREQNLLISQLNQALSQFIVETNTEMAGIKKQLEKTVSMTSGYPVGSIYISVDSTNPGELFGFGVWEQIKDCFLLSAGDIYNAGDVGEEVEYLLAVEGSGDSHPRNNMPPYLAVYVWKRTA